MRRSHGEKFDDEYTMMWQQENSLKSPHNRDVQLRVWAKEAMGKEEEEWMFLKKKRSESLLFH